MPRCAICMQVRPQLKFRTGRISICRYCVRAINHANLSARDAGPLYVTKFRRNVVRSRPEAASWPMSWFEQRLLEHIEDPNRVHRSLELRLLRAYRRGLVCLDRCYLKFPPDWPKKRLFVKRRDGFACHRCLIVEVESEGKALHVHHIIHRSRSGTNSKANLVTLCARCHQAEHPDIVIGADRGEPDGVVPDPEAPDGFPPHDPIWPALLTSVDPRHRARLPPAPRPPNLTPLPPVPTPASAPVPHLPRASIEPYTPVLPLAQRPPKLTTPEPAHPSATRASTADAFPFTAIVLLATVVAAVFLSIALAPTPKRVESAPPDVVQAAMSESTATAAMMVARSTSPSPGEQWQADASAFIAKRCELADMRPEVRPQVARNYRIFQRKLDELYGKAWSNRQLLDTAGERVYQEPGYTWCGTCP